MNDAIRLQFAGSNDLGTQKESQEGKCFVGNFKTKKSKHLISGLDREKVYAHGWAMSAVPVLDGFSLVGRERAPPLDVTLVCPLRKHPIRGHRVDQERIPARGQDTDEVDVPAGHRRCWGYHGAIIIKRGIIVKDGPNDVHRVIVGVLGVVAFLVTEACDERSRAERGLVGEAEVESRHGSLGGGEGLELSVGKKRGVVGKATDGRICSPSPERNACAVSQIQHSWRRRPCAGDNAT